MIERYDVLCIKIKPVIVHNATLIDFIRDMLYYILSMFSVIYGLVIYKLFAVVRCPKLLNSTLPM